MSAPNQDDYEISDDTGSAYTNATSFQSTLNTVVQQPASTLRTRYLIIERARLNGEGVSHVQVPTVPVASVEALPAFEGLVPVDAHTADASTRTTVNNEDLPGSHHPAVMTSSSLALRNPEGLATSVAPVAFTEARTQRSSPPHADAALSTSLSSSTSSRAQASPRARELVFTTRGHARGPGSTGSLPLPPAGTVVPKSGKAASTGSINPTNVDVPNINIMMKQHLEDQAAATATTGKSIATIVENTTGVREGLATLDDHMSANLNKMTETVGGTVRAGFTNLEAALRESMSLIADILRPKQTADPPEASTSSSRRVTTRSPASVPLRGHEEHLQREARDVVPPADKAITPNGYDDAVTDSRKGKGKQVEENPPDTAA